MRQIRVCVVGGGTLGSELAVLPPRAGPDTTIIEQRRQLNEGAGLVSAVNHLNACEYAGDTVSGQQLVLAAALTHLAFPNSVWSDVLSAKNRMQYFLTPEAKATLPFDD